MARVEERSRVESPVEVHRAVPVPSAATTVDPATGRFAARQRLRPHWPIVLVLALFAASALVVPTLAPIATTDDWGYARSVEILYHEGRLEVFPVVAATAVFQVVWGALFALLFEPTLGVMRLSTTVMVGLGGWALYGLCRQLGVGRDRAAMGVATYLFNPLAFVLAFTFMTDPHFASLLVIATLGYARGLETGPVGARATLAGSAVAACAFLTRQQGALIPLGVVVYLLLARRLPLNRAGFALLLRVVALPAVAIAGYYLWLRFVNEVPDVQTSFLREATRDGWEGAWWLLRRLTFFEQMYLGFFALPLLVAALPATRRLWRTTPRLGLLLVLGWAALLLVGLVATWREGGRIPYIGQFFGPGGPGAPDVLGSRPRLVDAGFRDRATVFCAVAALAVGGVIGRATAAAATPERAKAALVLAIAVWQVVGVVPPSFHYLRRGGSLDRYLLPLLPLAICLTLWALRDLPLARPVAVLVIGVYATVAVAGTRDYLVYMREVWDFARYANARGVPNDRLDAGSGWDGYHLYEYSRDNRIKSRTPNGPWWVYFYAPATDSTYVVAGKPLPDYAVVEERSYSSWLATDPTRLYLLRRFDAPWPPAGIATPVVGEGWRWGWWRRDR